MAVEVVAMAANYIASRHEGFLGSTSTVLISPPHVGTHQICRRDYVGRSGSHLYDAFTGFS
jgi:hypothetical protein